MCGIRRSAFKLSNNLSLISFGIISTLALTCITIGTIAIFQYESNVDSSLFLSLLILFCVNTFIGLSTFMKEKRLICQYFGFNNNSLLSLEGFHMISSSALMGFWLFCRSYTGACPTSSSDPLYGNWSCNPQYDTDTLPVDTMITLMLTPFIYSAIYEIKISCQVLLATWLITVSWILVCVLVFQAENSIFSLVFYTIFSFFSLYQTKFHNMKLHTEVIKKDDDIVRIKSEVETTIQEMQNMVSNVTHDLKSPLTVVTASATSVKEVIANSKKLYKSCLATVESLMDAIISIEDSMKHVNVMNIFMVQTINRVLDCSKVRTGMKLVPKNETFNIAEALELPITCMSASQDLIGIELLPMGHGISSHIITDKQWLQENIICLLSNAVKYSNTGTVKVSMSLVQLSDLPYTSVVRRNAILAKEKQENNKNNNEYLRHDIDSTNLQNDVTSSASNSNNNTPRVMTPIRKNSVSTTNNNENNGQNGTSSVMNSSFHAPRSVSSNGSSFLNVLLHKGGIPLNKVGVVPLPDNSSTDINHLKKISAGQLNSNSYSGSISLTRRRRSFDELASLSSNTPSHLDMFLLVEVQDTGIGISQEVMDNLFSPFKQAQSFAGGTGLGLYSLAKRVDALSGCYGVRARNDGIQGSVFWFAIPYKPDRIHTKLHAKHVQKIKSSKSMKSLETMSNSRRSSISGLDDTQHTAVIPVRENELDSTLQSSQHSDKCHKEDFKDLSSWSGAVCKPDENKDGEESEFEFHYTMEKIARYNTNCDTDSFVSDGGLDSIQSSEEILPIAPLNILLVDDSQAIRKLTGRTLRAQGHKVTEARNGEESLRKLEEVRNNETKTMKPFNVVIIDLHMPVMDGLESTKRLRKIENNLKNHILTRSAELVERNLQNNNTIDQTVSHHSNLLNPPPVTVPYKNQLVILCSANIDAATAKLAFDAGCDHIMEKPLSIAKFHKIYTELIAQDDDN